MPKQVTPSPFTFKFLLVGDGNVGKTSLVRRLCRNCFLDEVGEATVGVEFMTHMIEVNGTKVKLQIWDTAGQEKYRSIGKAYYRNSIGVLLVFSLTSLASFESLSSWIKDVRQYCHPKAVIIIVGNKSDLIDQREVTAEQAQQFAEANGLLYIESSAKTDTNVTDAFLQLARVIHRGVISNEIQFGQPTREELPATVDPQTEKKCKC